MSPIPAKVKDSGFCRGRASDIAYAANAHITGDESCRFVEVSKAFPGESDEEE